jgi:protein phosphatase 2C family protein 2/3
LESKNPAQRFGGNPNVTICRPDIKCFEVKDEHDFLLLASDGVCNHITNEKALKVAWEGLRLKFTQRDNPIPELLGQTAEHLLKCAAHNQSCENMSAVLISFKSLKKRLRYDLAKHLQ